MKLLNNFKKINNKFGFTLIEALVAISILMIAVANPITMAQKSLTSSMFARDQMIASFLAQDAIEGIKNIRDQNALNAISGGDWLYNLGSCICTDNCSFDDNIKGCNIDTTQIGTNNNYVVAVDDSNIIMKVFYGGVDGQEFKYFSFNGTDNTKFKRVINIQVNPANLPETEINGLNEAKVQVRVFWDSAMGEKKVDLVFFMYNYEPAFK